MTRIWFLISQVKLLRESKARPTSASHLRFLRPYLNVTLTLNLPRGTTYRNVVVCHEAAWHDTSISLNLISVSRTPTRRLFAMEYIVPYGPDYIPSRRSKTCLAHLLSHVTFFRLRKTPRCFAVISLSLSLLESSILWHFRSSGFKPL